ncbi:MAG: PorP/SprF family type IX secretion system membrane protein [Rhizobacter sp.]|nr:PorP/SprF family type IX secretion system membrane protein [Ferruginibacter sp.]
MEKLIKILLLPLLIFMARESVAQDLHFSQYFNSPLTTNPANTGFIPDADYRIGASYRNQWSSIMTVPYKTMSVFGDVQLFRDRLETGWLGLGGVILSDVAGSGSLRSTKIYGSVAYHQMLGYSSLLSAGFNVGYAEKRIDASKLKFPDQFDGEFFDGSLPTTGLPVNSSTRYFDLQAGINYAYFPQENVYINAGYSIQHVNKPRESFYADKSEAGIIPMRHIAFANAILKVHEKVILSPNAYFSIQSKATEIMGGLLANYNLSEAGETQLVGGVYYRHKDAIIPMAGFELNNLRFTFSYDVTTSSINNFNNGRGAMEFSLVKKGFYPSSTGRQSMCPSF